jgi:hypothetical protein
MKLGLDIHGVTDNNPKKFIELAAKFEEVHIITGISITAEVIDQLSRYNDGIIWWTKLVSITDELSKTDTPIGIDKHNRPIFSNYSWDSFKGKYCEANSIDIMIDDTERYRSYFSNSTIFTLYKGIYQ